MQKTKAAVLREHKGHFNIQPVNIQLPQDDEVLVEIIACGICHTDIVMRDGYLPVPVPVVLGHEGAGIVKEVGGSVTHVKAGDKVVLSFSSCGHCPSCDSHSPAYCHEFFPLNFFAKRADGSTALSDENGAIHSHVFGQSAFANHAISPARNVVKVDDDVDLKMLAPLGCGIQTGAGAVLNSLKVRKNASVLVMGAGAVGMSAIMASKIAGAITVIALDRSAERLNLSKQLGATHVLKSDGRTVSELLNEIGMNGVDYIVDTTGVLNLVDQALLTLNPRGSLALVAAYNPGEKLSIDMSFLMSAGRKIIGVVEGDSDPHKFIPQLIEYHKQGLLPYDKLIKFFDFAQINDAIEAGESGNVIKPIIIM